MKEFDQEKKFTEEESNTELNTHDEPFEEGRKAKEIQKNIRDTILEQEREEAELEKDLEDSRNNIYNDAKKGRMPNNGR